MTFTPTAEQLAIIEFGTDDLRNLRVIARAGAAKTTTLRLVAEALPNTEILSLAFNKRIATEMSEALPSNCTALTLNSLGHRAWGKFLRKRLNLSTKKNYNILSDLIKSLEDQDEKTEAWEFFAETLATLNHAKNCGWVPQRYKGYWKPLLRDEEFFATLDFDPTELQIDLITAAAQISFKQSLAGTIDFSDQLLCPAICPVEFPTYPLTLIDEAQDLSHLNHIMLSKLVRKNRIIAVGDPCQAIYGFRGAAHDSLDQLQSRFAMETRYLTTSFRCSKAVIANALWRAPDMRSPDWAAPGHVEYLTTWNPATIPDGSAIICRNNAPLFTAAIRLLKNNRLPFLQGRDIAYGLTKVMKKLGKADLSRRAALNKLELWKAKELERSRRPGQVHDRAACIEIFLTETDTLGDAIAYLEELFRREGRIELMTGHKSKGLEFPTVFFLDKYLIDSERNAQDNNIQYVIETRAQDTLYYVETSTWLDNVRDIA